MSKNSLFCPKKESSITQKVLIEIFFNVIFHLMYMVWLDLDAKSALDTGTPSVEAHKCAVIGTCRMPIIYFDLLCVLTKRWSGPPLPFLPYLMHHFSKIAYIFKIFLFQ